MPTLLLLLLPLLATVTSEYCTGDLVWNDNATVCIPTCTAHYYPDGELCPTRNIGRCVCPEGLIKLEDVDDQCVDAMSHECQQATKKYMDDPSTQFKFSKEPEDITLKAGESTTLTCLVSNAYTIQYIWYKLDDLPEGDVTAEKNLYMTGTSELVFKDVTAATTGYYQCKAVAAMDFLMISSVGRVRVQHFTTGATQVSEQRVTLYNPIQELECAEINADPAPVIRWYYDDELLDFEDTHFLMNKNTASDKFGSLYVTNVQNTHEGKYTCKGFSAVLGKTAVLAERDLVITGSQNTVSGAPKNMEVANFGSHSKVGTEGVLYCAGYGYPVPDIKWYKVVPIGEPQPEISGCTESICVSEGGRKLTIYNLGSEDFGDYQCNVENAYDVVTKIIPMNKAPDSYEVQFDSISAPIKIQPNRYLSFTLTCVVDTSQNAETYMGWYQNTRGIAGKGDRISTNSYLRGEQSVQELVFEYPTNDDHGVFQCLAYNAMKFKQATTDVYVYMSSQLNMTYNVESNFAAEMYDPNTLKEYKYFSTPMTAPGAESTCQEWKTDAHLSTILDYEENDKVFDVIMANKNTTNSTKAWIGLTDEATEGVWRWLSGEVSDRFCFWWKNHPDNSEADRDYAYMDAAKSGHWVDTDQNEKLPFVCKYYNGTCADLENQTELEDVDFKRYSNRQLVGRISIFDTAIVKCGSREAELVCAPSGKWVPAEGSVCPQIAPAAQMGASRARGLQSASILLILSYLLT